MPKAKSKKSIKKTEKQNISEGEFEKKIVELAEKGLTSEKIGESLRQSGIHPQEYNQKISKILKKNNLYINSDLKNIEAKLEKITKHYKKNKQDKRAQREKDRVFSQVRKMKKYLKQV